MTRHPPAPTLKREHRLVTAGVTMRNPLRRWIAAVASPAALTGTQILAIGRELAQCVRENGLPDYADPAVANGRLQLPPVQLPQQAVQARRSIMDRLPATAFGKEPGAARSAEDLAILRKWARCAREHGLAGWPDPDPEGNFVIRGTPLEDVPQPALDRVVEACKAFSNPGVSVIG
jgi:hypothetical protein